MILLKILLTCATVVVFLTSLCSSQNNILSLIQSDARISQFYSMVQSDSKLSVYFQNAFVCMFIPSNEALAAGIASTGIKNPEEIIKRHLFLSQSKFKDIKGTVANWNQYTEVKTKTDSVYFVQSFMTTPIYISNVTSSKPMVNGALVLYPDIAYNDQVYHIIDRALLYGYNNEFTNLLNSVPEYSMSASMWLQLTSSSFGNALINVTKFNANYLQFTNTFPGTILMPTNDAWNNLPPDTKTLLNKDNAELSRVLGRLYIPNRIIFLHDQPISFTVGFSTDPRVDDANSITGIYYKELFSNLIKVDGHIATIITPNIPFLGGVMHVIGSTMAVRETRDLYLTRLAPSFFTEITKDNDLKNVLAGNNTILAPDDQTMAIVNKMDPATKKQTLMNCFLVGSVTMATSNNAVLATAGNATVRISVSGRRIYVDTVAVLNEKTYLNRATIIRSDDTVQGVNINIISGTIGGSYQSCDNMFRILQLDAYKSVIDSLGVTLNIGSPYTLFVPTASALSQVTNVSASSNLTAMSTTIIPLTVPIPRMNVTGNSSIIVSSGTSTPASTTGASTSATAPSSTGISNPAMLQYLLQRMIVANRFVLAIVSTGSFRAATMNYAAMQEMLNVVIHPNSSISIGINGVSNLRDNLDSGFYCYSNDIAQSDRHNLLYPVDFVLVTGQDSSTRICVKAPCTGCSISYVRSLVLLLGCLLWLYRRV